MMKSWKTTLGGSITAAGAALIAVPTMQTQFDTVKLLPAEWLKYFVLMGIVMTIAGPLIHGIFARDNNVTSEAAGVAKPTTNQTPTP